MRRKGLLALTGCDPKRFELLQARDQLPILNRGRWAEYDLTDALALRLTLDLIGGEGDGQDQLGGVPPSYAHKVIFNALGHARLHYETLGDLAVHRVFLGGVIFQCRHEGDEGLRFSRWFAGPAEEIGNWIAETGREEDAAPVRMLLVDAGRAALQVIEAARELGISDSAEDEQL